MGQGLCMCEHSEHILSKGCIPGITQAWDIARSREQSLVLIVRDIINTGTFLAFPRHLPPFSTKYTRVSVGGLTHPYSGWKLTHPGSLLSYCKRAENSHHIHPHCQPESVEKVLCIVRTQRDSDKHCFYVIQITSS